MFSLPPQHLALLFLAIALLFAGLTLIDRIRFPQAAARPRRKAWTRIALIFAAVAAWTAWNTSGGGG